MLIDSLVNRFFYAGFNVTALSANPDLDVRTAPNWEPFFVVGVAIEHRNNNYQISNAKRCEYLLISLLNVLD